MSGYLSHTTLLSAAFNITTGPVLEVGMGLSSTLLLHGLCGSSNRSLCSIEADPVWYHALRREYTRRWHTIKKVDNFIDLDEYNEDWGLAFVDHGVIEERRHSIEALKNVPIVVVHDTCHPILYGYNEAFKHFIYQYDLKLFGPHTSALSNQMDVADIFKGFDL